MFLAMRWLILPVLGSLTASASAGLMQYRTEVQVSYGSGIGTVIQGAGGLQAPSSAISLAPSFGGAFSEASSSLSSQGYIPTLRTRSIHNGTRAQSVAWGVQGFTNVSSTRLMTSLVMNLTADLEGANDLDARVYLFQEEDFEFYRDPGTILFESSSKLWPGFEPFANNPGPTGFDILLGSKTGPVLESRSFAFEVNPGESFYVWAMLLGTAENRGTVDAFSTLTASLTNIDGLEPASMDGVSVVPEPSYLTFLSAAIIAVTCVFFGGFRKLRPTPIA